MRLITEEAIMLYTYDRSPGLSLALIARVDLGEARYVPLSEAPTEQRRADAPYLRQMHAVANSVPCGLTVMTRMPFRPELWEALCPSLADGRDARPCGRS